MSNEKPILPTETEWADETLVWFKAWRDSTRTDGWDAVQWQYMFDTALVHSAVYGMNMLSMLGELNVRLKYMGLVFEQPDTVKERGETPLDQLIAKRSASTPRRTGTKTKRRT